MKKIIVFGLFLSLLTVYSCQKDLFEEYTLTENSLDNATTTGSDTEISSYAIITERGGPDSLGQDSSACHCHDLTPLALTDLSQTIKDYVAANYAGANIVKAGTASDGKIFVMLKTATKPVVLVFLADGTFLQACEKHNGPHNGGPGNGGPGHGGPGHGGGHHNGPDLTSVDITLLPADISAYITTNYAGAVIKKAGTDANGNYFIMIDFNGKPLILVFNADGSFSKEIKKKGKK